MKDQSTAAFDLWILVLHLHKSSFSVGLTSMFMNVPRAQGDLGDSSATLGMSSLQNLGASFPEHCSTKGVALLGLHWNEPGDKAQGTGIEQLEVLVLATRQSLLASRGSTYSLKGCWPPPALQTYEFSNCPPGECKGKQYFGEVIRVWNHTFYEASFSLLWSTLQVFHHLPS